MNALLYIYTQQRSHTKKMLHAITYDYFVNVKQQQKINKWSHSEK